MTEPDEYVNEDAFEESSHSSYPDIGDTLGPVC